MAFRTIGTVYAALWTASDLADHWIQTEHQATTKGKPGNEGRRACAAHVAALTATQALTLTALCAATGHRLNPRRVALALALNAATHYVADRRTPLAHLATKVRKDGFYKLGDSAAAPTGTGAYALDQSFHHPITLIAAAIATT